MSLLLEALKKAERAKEEAQRRARGESGVPSPTPEAPAVERKPVVTRDKLPDISSSLEIVSEDLAPQQRERPPLEIVPEAPTAKDASRARPAAAKGQDEPAASRAAARKVFEAKFREPNPRMPFYITLAALGAFAIGTGVYFWYQLRSPPALVNLNPQRPAETLASAAPVQSAPAPAVTPSAIAGLPSAPSNSAPSALPAAPARAPVEAPPEAPRLAPAPRTVEPRASVTRSAPEIHPKVASGYAAYMAGDLATARADYEQALREEPTNRDALLGLAALDVRAERYESAEALYLRLLQADPRDVEAQAALIALRSGRSDPLATESRVKLLLAADPGAHALNFALGNQLASQNRWAEAQREYFKAYTAEPDNADFAYNLAVSLDHLRQPRQALDYYQRAILLADKHGASFALEAARARAVELAR